MWVKIKNWLICIFISFIFILFLTSCNKSLDDKTIGAIISKEKIIDTRVTFESTKQVYLKNNFENEFGVKITNNGNVSIWYYTFQDKLPILFNYYIDEKWNELIDSSDVIEVSINYDKNELLPGSSVTYYYNDIKKIPELERGLYLIGFNYYLDYNNTQPNYVNTFLQIK